MGPEGAENILNKRDLEKASDPDALRNEKIKEFRDKFATPFTATAHGFVDAVIEPRRPRSPLLAAFENLADKRDRNPPKKHGNIPL